MRRFPKLLLVCCVLAACKDGEGGTDSRVDPSQLTSSSGEVALSDGGSLEFSVTSDQYKQWYKAQQALDRRVKSQFGKLLQPASPSERSIHRAVEYLEGQPAARSAIERAGLTVRAFVVTTVALEQEMRVASESGTARPDTMAMAPPPPYPYPVDTTYPTPYPAPYPTTAPTPYPPAYATPYPASPTYPVPAPPAPLPERRVDSMPRVDTVFVPVPVARDTATRPDPLVTPRTLVTPPRDTLLPRRDSIVPRRDTSIVRRDTAAPRRDTLAPRPPRDTIPRDTLPHQAARSR